MTEYTDWKEKSDYFKASSSMEVPNSCCEHVGDTAKVEDCVDNPDTYKDKLPGCYQKLTDAVDENSATILIVAVVIVVIMVIECYLCVYTSSTLSLFFPVPEHDICFRNVHHGQINEVITRNLSLST